MLQFYCNYCMILWFSCSLLSLNRTVGIVSDIDKLNCTKLQLDTFLCISTTWHIMWNIFALKNVQYLIVRADWVERPRICQHITWSESLQEAQLLIISFKYVLHGACHNLNWCLKYTKTILVKLLRTNFALQLPHEVSTWSKWVEKIYMFVVHLSGVSSHTKVRTQYIPSNGWTVHVFSCFAVVWKRSVLPISIP